MNEIRDSQTPDAATVPRDLLPERDLWPAIAARVRARRRAARLRVAALAAGLVLAIGAAIWRLSLEPTTPPRLAQRPAVRAVETVGPAAYAEIDRTLDAIRDELQRSIEARQDKLPPETRALVFENLRTIDRAIAEIETALDGSPANSELARTYIAYRERQINLLRQANQLAARL